MDDCLEKIAHSMWQLVFFAICSIVALVYWQADIIVWHASFRSPEFNALAAWTGIYGLAVSSIGLFLSGYAAWGIRQIKTRFLIKARLPTLGKSLQKNAGKLSDMAEEQPVPQQERTNLFSAIEANLNAVRRHAPSQLRKSQKETQRAFCLLSRQASEQPDVAIGTLTAFWETYEKIQLLKNEIDHYLADEKWES